MPDNLEFIEEQGLIETPAPQADAVVPAAWGDLFLYLAGCLGGYFLLSVGVILIYKEINLVVTVLTALLNFLCFAGGVYLFGVRRGKLSWQGIGLQPPKDFWVSVLGGTLLAILVNVFRFIVMLVIILITGTELDSLSGRGEFFQIGLDTWQGVLWSLIGIGILVPVAEELFFRGLLYGWFRQKTPIWASVMITSLLFGLAHYDSWILVLSTFIMGVALALAYEYTKSIWISISMHIVTNSGAVLLMAFFLWFEDVLLRL